MELPKHFGQRMRDEINAGSESIKLRDFSFFFYESGLKLAKSTNDEDLKKTLRLAMSGDGFKTLAVRTLFR